MGTRDAGVVGSSAAWVTVKIIMIIVSENHGRKKLLVSDSLGI